MSSKTVNWNGKFSDNFFFHREESKSVPITAFRYASNSSAFLESKINHFVTVPLIQFKMAAIRFTRQEFIDLTC